MSTYRGFNKNNCMHLVIKEEKVFDKYNVTWEKVSYIIKKNNSEHKRKLSMFLYTSNID